jgi:Na+/H+-dicarboxylate symporter
MGALFHPQAQLAAADVAKAAAKAAKAPALSQILLNIVPTSVAKALVNETVLGIIFFALVFGIALSYMRVSKDERVAKISNLIYDLCDGFAQVIMSIIKGIMQYAPIGVCALVAVVLAKNGPKVIGSLGVVTAACFVGYALHILIVYCGGLVKLIGRLPLGHFIGIAKDPFITAFVTRSSNGTLPVTMQAAEDCGVKRDIYSFSLPLGATINMDGTAIYLGVCATFIALSVWGHGFTPSQMGIVVVTATLASIGTAGVPGAGALMLLMVLTSIGLPVEQGSLAAGAYAMVFGIDAILDMGRTALNVTGDLACTTVVAKTMGELDMSKWEKKAAA